MSCERCTLLEELYERTPKSDRDYWLMTELFVMLHGGLDFCRCVGENAPQGISEVEAMADNQKLKNALAALIPWAGEPPEGPAWATPEARARNRAMFEKAFSNECGCFPEGLVCVDVRGERLQQ